MNTIPVNASPNPINLLEYGDFSCPRCQELQRLLATIVPLFGDEICYTFRHFPNLDHPTSLLMALASEAARRQDQYWAMHHALFADTTPVSPNSLLEMAVALGLNRDLFLVDFHDETLKNRIWEDIAQGRLAEVVATPVLFIGTRRLHGRLTQARLLPLIRHYIGRSNTQVQSMVDCENSLVLWSKGGNQ